MNLEQILWKKVPGKNSEVEPMRIQECGEKRALQPRAKISFGIFSPLIAIYYLLLFVT